MKLLDVLVNLKETSERPARIPKEEQVLALFQEWLVSDERFKANLWRNRGGRFYPSGFGYECDRSLALKFCRAPEAPTDRDPRLEITFALGNGIHNVIQELFAEFSMAKGWLCEDEVRIKPDENPWFISGRVDIELTQPAWNRRRGVEIKSINNDGFNALHSKPQDKHIEQGNIYVGIRKLECMHYVYVNKDKSTFKEFVRPPDESLFEQTMLRPERILVSMQQNKFPSCDKCTRSCAFHQLNKQQPSLTVKDVVNENRDAHIAAAIQSFAPVFLRRTSR